MLSDYMSSELTINQATNYVGQQIILNKIAKSSVADKVLIKGGVVIFNMTHNLRRTTSDLDFDFIRYDISDSSIKKFIQLLNKYDSNYKVSFLDINKLRQEDYKGKRVFVEIKDSSTSIKFKLDIGVHTLFGIEQTTTCFCFANGENVILKINPPEQIFAEKLYSLAKHNVLSTRYKDIFDMYYFIRQDLLDRKIVRKCIELLTLTQINGLRSIEDVCNNVNMTFEDKQFKEKFKLNKDRWIDEDDLIIFSAILDFIYSI